MQWLLALLAFIVSGGRPDFVCSEPRVEQPHERGPYLERPERDLTAAELAWLQGDSAPHLHLRFRNRYAIDLTTNGVRRCRKPSRPKRAF